VCDCPNGLGGLRETMLIWEGLYYTLGSVAMSLLLSVVTGPLLSDVLESMFWFFTYRFTLLPILSLAPIFAMFGFVVPLMVYCVVSKHSIVERFREAE